MQKQAPSLGRLGIMVAFALSCFGLLLYLWTAFGGAAPFKAQGYRFEVSFVEATQLALQADVRISGVPVGKVVKIDRKSDRTLATVEMEKRYAPIPRDTRSTLRLKTLLGETFVELTPGNKDKGMLREGETLPVGQVQDTVEVDEILRAFDPPTRKAFRQWMVSFKNSVRGRGPDFNDALGNLPALAEHGGSLLDTLDLQRRALSTLVRDSGTVFGTIGRRRAAVQELINSGERVFARTADRTPELKATFEQLPPFLRELRPTLAEAEGTARDAAPVVRALRPAGRSLRPALVASDAISDDATAFFRELRPLIRDADRGLPATNRLLARLGPAVKVLEPLGVDLNPAVDYIGLAKADLTQAIANVAASTNASQTAASGKDVPYLRITLPLTNELIVGYDKRLPSNRHNAYYAPGGLGELAKGGLKSWSCSHLKNPAVLPVIPPGTGPPPCIVQEPFTFQGRTARFPQVRRSGQ